MTGERFFLVLAGVFGAAGVASGASAAHGLEAVLTVQQIGWVDTASRYLLWHAPVLMLIGIGPLGAVRRSLPMIAGGLISIGLVLFSGGLVIRATMGIDSISFLIPIGGLGLILGWSVVAIWGVSTVFQPRS